MLGKGLEAMGNEGNRGWIKVEKQGLTPPGSQIFRRSEVRSNKSFVLPAQAWMSCLGGSHRHRWVCFPFYFSEYGVCNRISNGCYFY